METTRDCGYNWNQRVNVSGREDSTPCNPLHEGRFKVASLTSVSGLQMFSYPLPSVSSIACDQVQLLEIIEMMQPKF